MLTTTASVIAPKVLKELIAAGSVTSARVESGDKGLMIVVRVGMNERCWVLRVVAFVTFRALMALQASCRAMESCSLKSIPRIGYLRRWCEATRAHRPRQPFQMRELKDGEN